MVFRAKNVSMFFFDLGVNLTWFSRLRIEMALRGSIRFSKIRTCVELLKNRVKSWVVDESHGVGFL